MKRDIFKDDNTLIKAVDDFFDDQHDVTRIINERIIFRNILYYIGEQYIEFVRSTGTFRRRNSPDFTPTPVSNEVREYVRSIKAMLMNQKMVPRVWPNTSEKEDNQAAELGENLLTWMDQSQNASFFDEKEKLCIWLSIAGTAFMRTYPNAEGGLWLPDGSKTGDVACESILPFNIRLDTLGDSLDKKRWIGVQSLKDREWVEDTFKVKIEHTDSNKTQIDYQKRLAKLVGTVSPWKGQVMELQTLETDDDDVVLFKEIEFAPVREFPNGKYVCTCGGKLLVNVHRLPIAATPDYWTYSLTDFHYNYVPGRFWSDPGVNDLISPQNIINEIDQALSINRKGIGRPKIIVAGEVGLKKLDMGGHGFLALQYNPIMGQKPDFQEGTPLPAQVLEERRLQKEQMQDASGDPKNVLKGQAPSANASGILTENLKETAESGRYPDVDRFNRSLTRVYKKRLLLAQEIYTEERLIKITGRGNKVKIVKFKASDLRGNTDVRLELDSGLIATKSGQAQMMLNMIQAGFFKEGETDPTLRQEVLQRLGMSSFTDETNNDVDRAESENMAIASGSSDVMTAKQNPETGEDEVITDDPLFKYDNHASHYETHRKYIISPEFKEIPIQSQVMALYHADTHKKLIDDAKPDLKQFVQLDKLIPLLTQQERAQVLQDIGIQPGDETMIGIPEADTVLKAKQKMIDTDKKETNKQVQMKMDLLKHSMTEQGKIYAVQHQKSEGRGEGKKP